MFVVISYDETIMVSAILEWHIFQQATYTYLIRKQKSEGPKLFIYCCSLHSFLIYKTINLQLLRFDTNNSRLLVSRLIWIIFWITNYSSFLSCKRKLNLADFSLDFSLTFLLSHFWPFNSNFTKDYLLLTSYH